MSVKIALSQQKGQYWGLKRQKLTLMLPGRVKGELSAQMVCTPQQVY